jgi:signal transduction histidine kinase
MSVRDDEDARERLAGLVGRLQEQVERDRAALALLLHDELGGVLAVARMTLSRARRDSAVSGDVDLLERLAELESQLAQAFDVKRRAVEQLRPGLLDHFGLGVALPALYEPACRDAGVQLTVSVARDLPAPAPERAIALYRIGEAALARMLRAGARRIELVLEAVEGGCALGLRHDGADEGFDTAPEFQGFGLWLARLQGQLAIQRAVPSGCTLRASLPARPR